MTTDERKRLEKLTERGNFQAKALAIVTNLESLGYRARLFETLRTLDRQRQLVARGVSKTLNSYHLAGRDGKARAFDVIQDDADPWSTTKADRAFWLTLGRLAVTQGCEWGGLWIGKQGDPRRAKLRAFLMDRSTPWNPDAYTGVIGWDPVHVQTIGVAK